MKTNYFVLLLLVATVFIAGCTTQEPSEITGMDTDTSEMKSSDGAMENVDSEKDKIMESKEVSESMSDDSETMEKESMETSQNGVSETDSMKTDDSMVDDSMKEDSMKEGRMTDDSMMDDSMKEDSMKEGSMTDESMMDDSMKEDSMKEGSMTDDSMMDDSMKEDSMEKEGMMEDSMKEEPMPDRSEKMMEDDSMMMDSSESDMVDSPVEDEVGETESSEGEMKDPEPVEEVEISTVEYTGTVLAGTESTKLLEFSQSDYEKALDDKKHILFYFYASWCPTCRREFELTKQAFNELDQPDLIGFRVNYKDSDTDSDEEALAREHGITYQHTKVVLTGGERVVKDLTTWSKEQYIEKMTSLIDESSSGA